ncbi:MAG: stage II sporulation protein M [Halanaerobiales bacterium]
MKRFYNFYFKQELPIFVFIITVFVLGIIFGSFGIKTIDYGLRGDLFEYFNAFTGEFLELEYETTDLIKQSIKFNLISIGLFWIFALPVFTLPLIPFLIFLRGFVLGFTSAFLLNQFYLKGILIVFFLIFPQNIFFIPAHIFSAVSGICLGRQIFHYYRGYKRLVWIAIKKSFNYFFICTVLSLLGILIEAYLSPVLMRLLFKVININ